MKKSTRLTNPHDIEAERRAIEFHEKLALLKAGIESKKSWDLAIDAAGSSHFLWQAKRCTQQPDFWASITALDHIVFYALGGAERGGTVDIKSENSAKILALANSDPDAHDQLKKFCGYAIANAPHPNTDSTKFGLDHALKEWVSDLLINGKGRPRSRKKGIRDKAIIDDAIAFTVQMLYDQGLPIFRNIGTYSSINACDAVAKVSDTALGRTKKIEGETVKRIFYASSYGKIEKR